MEYIQKMLKLNHEQIEKIVLPMNGQMADQNGKRRRDIDDYSVKLSTIRIWMHEKEIGKLTRILWAGQGNRLCQQASRNSRMKRFLAAVPYVMNAIKEVHQAVIDNNLETLLAKLEPPVPQALITAKDSNGLNIIHKAAGLGHTKILEYLISVWPEGLKEVDITGKTPLHWAASAKNNMRCYTILTQAGCDEEAVDYRMKSPTYYRHKPHEIERAFLVFVPDAPRVSPDVPTDWDALNEDVNDGKKGERKASQTTNGSSVRTDDGSIENSELDLNDGISANGEDIMKETEVEPIQENGQDDEDVNGKEEEMVEAGNEEEDKSELNGQNENKEVEAEEEENNDEAMDETSGNQDSDKRDDEDKDNEGNEENNNEPKEEEEGHENSFHSRPLNETQDDGGEIVSGEGGDDDVETENQDTAMQEEISEIENREEDKSQMLSEVNKDTKLEEDNVKAIEAFDEKLENDIKSLSEQKLNGEKLAESFKAPQKLETEIKSLSEEKEEDEKLIESFEVAVGEALQSSNNKEGESLEEKDKITSEDLIKVNGENQEEPHTLKNENNNEEDPKINEAPESPNETFVKEKEVLASSESVEKLSKEISQDAQDNLPQTLEAEELDEISLKESFAKNTPTKNNISEDQKETPKKSPGAIGSNGSIKKQINGSSSPQAVSPSKTVNDQKLPSKIARTPVRKAHIPSEALDKTLTNGHLEELNEGSNHDNSKSRIPSPTDDKLFKDFSRKESIEDDEDESEDEVQIGTL